MRLFLLSGLLIASTSSIVPTTCFPKNNLDKEDCLYCEDMAMTEAQFNSVLAQVQSIYAPIVKSQGATLNIQGDWNDSTVNAYANKTGNVWNVQMFGGLACRPETTLDGFALVVCHELGHHLAGYPFYSGSSMASEGQSDYFSTQACAKKIWANSAQSVPAPNGYKSWCASRGGDVNLCLRTLLAGESLARLLAKLNGEKKPQYNTPDKSTVSKTYEAHPAGQARLDTYLAGHMCDKVFPTDYIPGLASDGLGYNTKQTERPSLVVTCKNRPQSWFKPLTY